MPIDVAILLSIGRHPVSGRARAADGDSRALELALRLGDAARLHAVHAGDPAEPALADYLGMGLASLTVLRQPEGADVLPALAAHLAEVNPALLLTGAAAERGEGGGLLPYLLAARLGATLLPAIAEVGLVGSGVAALQALPRGRRRRLSAPLPCLATVDRAAPAPRQSAFGRARRGRILAVDAPIVPAGPDGAREIAARPKPKRLKLVTGASAAERLRAATEMQAGRGELLVDPPADEAAAAIFEYLVKEGILGGGGLVEGGGTD